MKFLIAGISALALAATPALAQGNGNGNGNGNRGNQSAQNDNRGNGNANRGNGNAQRDNRGNGNANRGNDNRGNDRGGPPQMRGNDNRGGPPAARGNDRGGPPAVGNNGNRGNAPARIDTRGNGNGNGNANRGPDRRGNDVDIVFDRGGLVDYVEYRSGARRLADGCPPGLARKYNGCRPPGLARQQDRRDYRRYSPDWWGYGNYYDRGGNYFYDDGFLFRLGDGGRISGYIPLLGGALSIGNPWPVDYRYSRMPAYYESYYGLGQPDYYRYSDNVVYRLDPETAAITSVAALLTGSDFVVGQPMPRGYDVYNVPYSYRDRYYDRPDAYYRYNNGYVYQIDPETMLVASAIELLI